MKAGKNQSQETMNPENVLKLIKETDDESSCIILDVRTPWEFSKEHIKGAENIDCTDPDRYAQILGNNYTTHYYCRWS